ncbi:MAG: LapA family protein [Mucilaginibacter sp.]|jgi:uncharacterized integral membrane protein
MRIKTMIIIIITVLLTVVVMQNTDEVPLKFLFAKFFISKLTIMLVTALIGFMIGLLVGRPGRTRYVPGQVADSDPENKNLDTLSDEDREYIS